MGTTRGKLEKLILHLRQRPQDWALAAKEGPAFPLQKKQFGNLPKKIPRGEGPPPRRPLSVEATWGSIGNVTTFWPSLSKISQPSTIFKYCTVGKSSIEGNACSGT